MGQNDHGGHTSEDEGDGGAEQDEVIVGQKGRVGREEPGHVACGEHNHRNPFLQQRSEREALLLASSVHIKNTAGQVTEEESGDQNRHPDVLDRVVPEQRGNVDQIGDRARPDAGSPDSGGHHNGNGDEKALSGTVEVAQVQGVSVESLPGREVHGETRHKRSVSTKSRRTEAHSRSLQKAGEGAVQRVNSVAIVRQ